VSELVRMEIARNGPRRGGALLNQNALQVKALRLAGKGRRLLLRFSVKQLASG